MKVNLHVQNQSTRKRLYRSDTLRRIAERVCLGEGVQGEVELSVVFCDDPFIQELNRNYRQQDRPTDVLSFPQPEGPADSMRMLGDIVVSLETVERHCAGQHEQMIQEVRLLVCHGLLHLLGYDHGTKAEQEQMNAKQAAYLHIEHEAAWSASARRDHQ